MKTSAKARTAAPAVPAPVLSGGVAAVDLPVLSRAIRRSVGHDGMRKEDAEAIAGHILNFFGFNERIIDNVLEPDDRDTFYMLEDSGILETERDETTLYDGREWRIHYWMFRKDRILQLAREEEAEPSAEPAESSPAIRRLLPMTAGTSVPTTDSNVYHHLSDEVWGQREGPDEEEAEDAGSSPLASSNPSRYGRAPSSSR